MKKEQLKKVIDMLHTLATGDGSESTPTAEAPLQSAPSMNPKRKSMAIAMLQRKKARKGG